MTVKVRVNRVYRGVSYSIELDLMDVKSVEQVGPLVQKAEKFIDRMVSKERDAFGSK